MNIVQAEVEVEGSKIGVYVLQFKDADEYGVMLVKVIRMTREIIAKGDRDRGPWFFSLFNEMISSRVFEKEIDENTTVFCAFLYPDEMMEFATLMCECAMHYQEGMDVLKEISEKYCNVCRSYEHLIDDYITMIGDVRNLRNVDESDLDLEDETLLSKFDSIRKEFIKMESEHAIDKFEVDEVKDEE